MATKPEQNSPADKLLEQLKRQRKNPEYLRQLEELRKQEKRRFSLPREYRITAFKVVRYSFLTTLVATPTALTILAIKEHASTLHKEKMRSIRHQKDLLKLKGILNGLKKTEIENILKIPSKMNVPRLKTLPKRGTFFLMPATDSGDQKLQKIAVSRFDKSKGKASFVGEISRQQLEKRLQTLKVRESWQNKKTGAKIIEERENGKGKQIPSITDQKAQQAIKTKTRVPVR